MTQITVRQEEIEVKGRKYKVTHIPTATSGMWFTVHDTFEVWGAVAIDLDGTVIGWKNPPDEYKADIEAAIKKAFGLPLETGSIVYCDKCGGYLGDLVDGVLYKFGKIVTEPHICEKNDG